MTYGLAFVKAAGERAVGMFAGTLGSVLMANGSDLFDAGWKGALGTAGMAALLSVLASVAKGSAGPVGPGFTETLVPDPPDKSGVG